MNEPEWLLKGVIVTVHEMLIAEHGGTGGIRDDGLLESALDRARNRWGYDPGASIFDLAAAYAFGLARNHPFVDGNKRTALTAAAMFLSVNGYRFAPDKAEAVVVVVRLAAGELTEEELARWIGANATGA